MTAPKKPKRPSRAKPAASKPKKRPTRAVALKAMVERPEGATLDEIMEAFGIQPHTARAMISLIIRKGFGLTVRYDKTTRSYHID